MSTYTLRDIPELHGTVVQVEAVYLSDPGEPLYIRLRYADGRQITLSPTGWETEGLSLEPEAIWFDTRLREDKPIQVPSVPLR